MKRSALAACVPPLLLALGIACQPGMSTTPAIAPAPPLALGLPLYVAPEPKVEKLEDEVARPLTVTLVHEARDALEAAGFKLAPTAEAASGLIVTITIQHAGAIHADLFIHGAEACGVRLDIVKGDSRLASAEPEVQCISSSAYYGMLPKDAAISMVNAVSHAPGLIAVAETIHPPPPASPPPPPPLPSVHPPEAPPP